MYTEKRRGPGNVPCGTPRFLSKCAKLTLQFLHTYVHDGQLNKVNFILRDKFKTIKNQKNYIIIG